MTSSSSNSAIAGKYSVPFLLILIAAGLAGNHFKFPIFFGVDFLFGSIFAMLALQFFGLGRGILAAGIIAGYTYIFWNHPYAIIIMTAEVAIVGWLIGYRKMEMVLADTLYWLIIGMPLVYLFYHLVRHTPLSNTYILMTKLAINGIANTLVARLIFTAYALRSRSLLTSYREIVYNLLAFFVLCPALIMLAVESRTDFNETDRQIRSSLIRDSGRLSLRLETWGVNRKTAILNLAEMAASRSPQQMQPYLELAKKSDVNFLRIGLHDKGATTTAYFPLKDELGQSTIGKNFAERPFIPMLKQTLKPMLSEVSMSRTGTPMPRVAMLAPVVIDKEYSGYVIGVLNLHQIQEHLDKSAKDNAMLYTLLDKNSNVIMTNRSDQKVMTPFVSHKGTLNRLDAGISQWIPVMSPNTPVMERWGKSFYVAETAIGELAEWELILEQPVAPFQKKLYDNYTGKLTMVFLILLGALALAEILSRKTVSTLGQLSTLTYELPVRIATDGKVINWPESGILEAKQLINNFRQMADSLAGQFNEIKLSKESLEQRVEERTHELKASRDHWELTFNSIPDMITILDLDYHILHANQAMLNAMNSYQRGSQLDEPCYTIVHGLDAPPDYCPHSLLLHDGQEHRAEVYEPQLGIYLSVTVTPLHDADGKLSGSIHVARDISERKLGEEKLLKAKSEAEAANLAKSQFLSNISHEIRTPLNGVVGLTELLLITELTGEQRQYAEHMKKAGNNLVQLISNILDLSKIEAHKIELESRDFDLRTEITDVISILSLQADEKELALSSLIDPDVTLLLKGDTGRLRQIITNLVGNSIKFTANGSVLLHIRKDSDDEQRETLRFLVRDTGIGIAADKLAMIFDPFTQADSSTTRKHGGTGLGLNISRQLVEMMGGNIGVASLEGKGSTFWFSLPLEKQSAGNLNSDSQKQPPLNFPLINWQVTRILLAEDDPTNQLVTRALLEKFGYQVDTANNGSEAIKALESNDYALVLMDCMMPVMNGYETTAVIRDPASTVRNHAIPVIALTASAFKEDRDRCFAVGMDDYLSKPIEVADVLAMLEKWGTMELIQEKTAARDAKSSADTIDIFNMAEFVARSEEDLELAREVAGIFTKSAPGYLDSIRKAVTAGEAAAVIQSAHKLRGAATNIALPLLSESARMIEFLARSGNLEKGELLLPELEQRLEEAIRALKKVLIAP